MKLALIVEKDDPVIQEGGDLATKSWRINGEIVVLALSGFQDGYWRMDKPSVAVRAHTDWRCPPDYRIPFDIAALENALNEARTEVARMEEFIAAKFLELKNA